jgi:hypothetical protein
VTKFTRLRYKNPDLQTILGGKTAVIESPLIREIVAESAHKYSLKVLVTRFGPVPPDVEAEFRSIYDDDVLETAMGLAASSPDLERFAADLRAIPRPPEPWDPAEDAYPAN